MTKNILLIVFGLLSVCFLSSYFIVLNKFKKVSNTLKKTLIDNAVMQEYISIMKTNETKPITEELLDKENFIKFLSDSRDWAFSYIESVQKGLTKFVNDVDADVSYFDEYGEALSMSRPDYPLMKNISKAYKELKTLLPEDEIKQ